MACRIMQMMTDFHACTWPNGLNAMDTSLAAHFDAMNDEAVADVVVAVAQANTAPVITFSHFLPLQVLPCKSA